MKELEERAKITTTKAHRRKGIRVCRPVVPSLGEEE
jgi:hypothetical protein